MSAIPLRHVPSILDSKVVAQGENKLREASPVQGPSRFMQDFEPLELLGRGAFGEVWRCRHLLDGREYAVKAVKYRISTADGGHLRHRVLREVQTWARLSHPHIVRYHSSWVEVEQTSMPGLGNGRSLPSSPRASSTRSAPAFWANGGSPQSCPEDGSHGGITFGDLSGDAQELQATAATSPTAFGRTSRATFGVGVRNRAPEYTATLYIQTELCSKGTVQTWIEKRNLAFASSSTTPEEKQKMNCEASNIFSQVASATAELHEAGCAHRDIKPSNILFDRAGRVQLGDFGLAKEMNSMLPLDTDGRGTAEELTRGEEKTSVPAASSSTQTLGVGTPAYASPQQLADGRYGVETDIFSLGVVLAELLCPVQTQMERARLIEGLRHGRCLPALASAAFPAAAKLVLAMTDPEPTARPTVSDLVGVMPQLLAEMQQPIGGDSAPAQMPQAHERAEPEGWQQIWSASEEEGMRENQGMELPSRPGDARERGHGPEDHPQTAVRSTAVEEVVATVEGVQAKLESPSCEPRKCGSCFKVQELSASVQPPYGKLEDSEPGDAMPLVCRKFALLLVLFGLDRLRGLGGASCHEGTTQLELPSALNLGIGLGFEATSGHCAVETDPLLYGSQLLRLLALACAAVALANMRPMRISSRGLEEEPGHDCAHLQGILGSLWP